MRKAKDITESFGTLYHPKSALVFYQTDGTKVDTYVEYFDMDGSGTPINAHPLTVREARALAESLASRTDAHHAFLKPKGIIPTNVLHIDPSENGSVLWYTKAQQRSLYFREQLGIANGTRNIPPLLWRADRQYLALYGLSTERRPSENTALYHAPFFNVYENGNVCMGTVDVKIKQSASLEGFIAAWENYFFNSYFSHLVQGHNPIKGNCVSLWKKLADSTEPFPKDVLVKTKKTLKNLIR